MKKGDKIKFKKFEWEIIGKKKYLSGNVSYQYRVIRKYYGGLLKLSNTKKTYEIKSWRWNFLKKQLEKNPHYHYNMSLWSNNQRI
jgi:hypothetical protein